MIVNQSMVTQSILPLSQLFGQSFCHVCSWLLGCYVYHIFTPSDVVVHEWSPYPCMIHVSQGADCERRQRFSSSALSVPQCLLSLLWLSCSTAQVAGGQNGGNKNKCFRSNWFLVKILRWSKSFFIESLFKHSTVQSKIKVPSGYHSLNTNVHKCNPYIAQPGWCTFIDGGGRCKRVYEKVGLVCT